MTIVQYHISPKICMKPIFHEFSYHSKPIWMPLLLKQGYQQFTMHYLWREWVIATAESNWNTQDILFQGHHGKLTEDNLPNKRLYIGGGLLYGPSVLVTHQHRCRMEYPIQVSHHKTGANLCPARSRVCDIKRLGLLGDIPIWATFNLTRSKVWSDL